MSDEWETSFTSHGITHSQPGINNRIDLAMAKHQLLDDEPEPGTTDTTRSPPNTDPMMFPGILKEIISACCQNSEAVPVAVAANVLLRMSALIGPTLYLPIGDERRLLNDYMLMVGSTGLGKGSSNHGPARIFNKVEEYLAEDLKQQFDAGRSDGIARYPWLTIHTGGLSSGEGLAAAMDDNSEPPVTDKRMLVFEPEFSTVMTMSQRTGNNLSMVLRNGFDGVDIKPLTKRDKVQVTDPYLCLMGNITARELTCHDQSAMMTANGMLNRFLILWQQPTRAVPFPEPMSADSVDCLAEQLAQCIHHARGCHHETYYTKVRQKARMISLDDDAKAVWAETYHDLLNRPDCDRVQALTRRHRLHALILSALFALLDHRQVIQPPDIHAAMAWIDYSRQSVIYSYSALTDQQKSDYLSKLSYKLLFAVNDIKKRQAHCSRTDLHHWFHGKLRRDQLQNALERLLCHIPPLIAQTRLQGDRGAPTSIYSLTEDARQLLASKQV